jgi:hypothetical protein
MPAAVMLNVIASCRPPWEEVSLESQGLALGGGDPVMHNDIA